MTATMNPTALFQYYVQKVFKFPKEIKNDIVYCQRALKSHIKVHQMVLDVYKSQGNPNPSEKQRVTDELETQIYEINAEQQYLLLRLRREISTFHRTMERKGILVIPNLIIETISSELVPLINDQNYLVYPISVNLRSTEEQLIEKYFEAKKNDAPANDYFEILDSDEEEKEENITGRRSSYKQISSSLPTQTYSKEDIENQKKSLLSKGNDNSKTESFSGGASKFVEVTTEVGKGNSKISAITPNITFSTIKKNNEPKAESIYPVGISVSKYAVEKEPDDTSVSQNIKMSRLNLRQVLKNAQSGNMATKTTTTTTPTPTINMPSNQTVLTNKKEVLPTSKKQEPITGRLSSSSDDSNPERGSELIKSNLQRSADTLDTRLKPEDYGQEMFLRIFGLYTPEMQLQMQQRRSKRKRRTVQSNERSDYHYGHIEYTNCAQPDEKKKRKAFLLSPQVKRKIGRPAKRRSVEKADEIISSRSGSSSPNEKFTCSECLKSGGTLECCCSCKAYYHQSCHEIKDKSTNSKKSKTCPPCRRLMENETKQQQQQSLQKNADKLNYELRAQKTRHRSLQQRSEKFKNQMSALFKIIKAIKNDADCSNLD